MGKRMPLSNQRGSDISTIGVDPSQCASVAVRIVYAKGARMQVRPSTVQCRLNVKREAVALL